MFQKSAKDAATRLLFGRTVFDIHLRGRTALAKDESDSALEPIDAYVGLSGSRDGNNGRQIQPVWRVEANEANEANEAKELAPFHCGEIML